MPRVFRSKLLLPVLDDLISRPRLLEFPRPRILIAQAPAGGGKTVFLTQWLAASGLPCVYYQLDGQDRDGSVFAAHLLAGLQTLWPDWSPPPDAGSDPGALAAELVNEAAVRPPMNLVLDRLEAAFGQAYLADFLALLARYAPPGVTLALGTRAPLPADLTAASGRAPRLVTATDLAFTPEEAEAWLGSAVCHECHAAVQGFPLGVQFWRQYGEHWRSHLTSRLLEGMPDHIPADVAAALVAEWLAGRLTLADFAYQVAEAQVGLEQLMSEVQALRELMLVGEVQAATERLAPLWESARSSGDRQFTGLVALLRGEVHYCRGEYAAALDWYGRAFEADPLLKTTGCHSMVLILKDLGQLEEAEELGQRFIAGCRSRGDLQALSYALCQYASVCAELGRFDEADALFRESERVGIKLSGEPFYGTVAMALRSVSYLLKGDMAEFRRVAEEAYHLARRRSPWLAAICGYILVPALFAWREFEEGRKVLQQSLEVLTRIDAKWQLHCVHYILAKTESGRGNQAAAQTHLDRALSLAAREGYVQYLKVRSDPQLIADALARGVETAFCQDLLIRMGEKAVPALVELAGRPERAARLAALYPLARIGGEQAAGAIRDLMYDADEAVRDATIMAYRTLAAPVSAAAPGPAAAMPGPAPPLPPALALGVLGPMTVAVAGQVIMGWRTVKARDLIAYLVLAGERPVTRDQLIEALWPDADLESGQALLHTTLYYLRRTLKPAGEGLITFAGGAYRLDRERVSVDLDRFQQLAGTGGAPAWRVAADLYRGDLLEGLDYPWVEAPRARARATCMEMLRSLAGHLRSAGRPGEAVDWLQRLITLDPLAEEGHVGLMECYAAIGNRNAALQQYRTLARVLDEELGLQPGRQAQELYRKLLD